MCSHELSRFDVRLSLFIVVTIVIVTYCLCDCKCVLDTGGSDATASMWKPEDSSLEFYLSHVYVVSREKAQLTRLAEHPSCQPLPIVFTECVLLLTSAYCLSVR